MNARMRVGIMVTVPLRSGTLDDALAEARKLKFADVIKAVRNANHVDDYNMEVAGIETGDWTPEL